jgi:hypothetical protein
LSTTFSENVGLDDLIVFNGSLSLSSSDTPISGAPGAPREFDIVIPFTTRFRYDPGSGNLLLDVRNFGGGFTTSFDAQSAFLDPISRVFSANANPALGVNRLTAANRDTLGLVTNFTTVAIPEPQTWLMMIAGFGFTGWQLRRQSQRRQRRIGLVQLA